ncbi:MAG: energy-coupling factor transporter ATPase [Traorella sp.]
MPIEIRELSHIYNANSPLAKTALNNVSLHIDDGEMVALIGETGSGKSTLVQHLNALLVPTSGELTINGKTIYANVKNKGLKELRKTVGLVFQFPEYQLFEETILKDIAFGPKNFGVSEKEAEDIAREMITRVGLDESYLEKSPFECSGGEKRRIAIAGILAMNPDILVFDEPTAGLDPKGAKDMMELFSELNKKYHKTVMIVSHDMEHVLNYCQRVIVMSHGEKISDCSVKEFFKDSKLLREMNINPPHILQLKDMLREKGIVIRDDVFTIEECVRDIVKEVRHG